MLNRDFKRNIKIGYVPMLDCASLIIARELGYFQKYDVSVVLSREAGWASVREKLINGELHASHAPASMVFELTCGLGVLKTPSLTGLVTALNGNAITLSNELWDLGVRDARTLKKVIDKFRGKRIFTFAGVLNYSSQHYLMRDWLLSGGIDPERDVRMAIVPPPLVSSNLQKGYLDGYCVAEPWSTNCVQNGRGWVACLTSDFSPYHIEKVFVVTEAFDSRQHEEHLAILRALMDAADFCDKPENREQVAQILAQTQYLDLPIESLKETLVGPFNLGNGRTANADEAIIFSRNDAGRPTAGKASWVLEQIRRHKLDLSNPSLNSDLIASVYREDIYEEAIVGLSSGSQENREQTESLALADRT
ncbi:CmpA/NrtA family ABC transporter substrate-binding protein [Rubellicoccus peritrichatus]|uniref:CmpA/NrtA family ABC transporter substrate-binding protein n=1 Tax=Rubellicoccus peritrichatus TaxID=3080537 RepID=A0AAQ3L672_9BACT|nr:CmpA/NrtA family ABC transporter substrate-binding protein [Puniceicoccus sp. CR14]WOO40229.1 CmpA/NrtA family ABC transporter substrate-binding protein [Puniceicoccus sp. CR14]